ncbi:phosphoribosylformylglycinamidine synthase subunit PurS [Lacticaseibacillus saniviri]
MYQAKVYVNYKDSVLDPKAEAIKTALTRASINNVQDLMVGKYFELRLTADNQLAAEQQVDAICDQLLANINMEQYRYTVSAIDEVQA